MANIGNTQQQIDYGASANDGTGDPLRTAFIKTDDNFDNVWLAGPVGSNITIINNTIQANNTNGNLILNPNGVGVIQTNSKLSPRLNNTYDLGTANLRYRTGYFGAGGIETTGNLTLGNIANLRISGGTNGYVIQTDGTGNLSWTAQTGSGNGNPGGTDTQVQFNDGGLFAGAVGFTFNKTSNVLSIPGNITGYNGNVVVDADGPQWSFKNDGSLQLPLGTITGSGNIIGPGNISYPFGPGVVVSANIDDSYGSFFSLMAVANVTGTLGYMGMASFGSNSSVGLIETNDSTGNTYAWYFNPEGTTQFPNYTFPLEDGSNTQVLTTDGAGTLTWSNAAASTGNVTFNDINIIGTGNLHLQPDPANAGSYLDIFLTSGPDLHLVASASANLILGKDNDANVMTSWNGNVYVQSWNQNTATPNIWRFDGDGQTYLPDGTQMGDVEGANTFGFYTSDNALQYLFEGPNNVTWGFNVGTGGTGFPTLNVQRGDNPSGTIQGQTLLFGDATQEAIISTPDGNDTSGVNSQRLVINPGQGFDYGEGGDIYLWAGRGGENNGSGGDIKIRGGQGMANGTGGYIRIEGGDSQQNGYPGYIDIRGGSGGTTQGAYVRITGGTGATNGGEAGVIGGYGTDVGGDANITAGYGGTNQGGNVNITGGGSALGLAGYGNININAGASQWVFNNTGNLTAPGSISAVGNIIGGNITTGGIANLYSVRMSQSISWPDYSGSEIYEDGGLVISGPGGVFASGNIAAQFEFNDGLGNTAGLFSDIGNSVVYSVGNVIVRSNNSVSQTDWTFDTTGNLTVPGNIIMTTGIVGSGASPAPYLSGFSSLSAETVSATGNITVGNLITAGSGGDITLTGGNITGANIISATGNITASYFIGNLATPTYGSFYDTTTQTNSNVGNAIPISYNTTDISNSVSIAGAGNTQITISETGIYNIQFSLQVRKTDGGSDTVYVWLDKNGNRVANSGTALFLSGSGAAEVAAWNFVVSAAANDYYRLMWMSTDSHVEIVAVTAGAVVPAIPSVILTVVPVGA